MLHMIQARDPALVGRPFFAEFDPEAVWLSDLRPAFADRFPFEAPDRRAAWPGRQTGTPSCWRPDRG